MWSPGWTMILAAMALFGLYSIGIFLLGICFATMCLKVAREEDNG